MVRLNARENERCLAIQRDTAGTSCPARKLLRKRVARRGRQPSSGKWCEGVGGNRSFNCPFSMFQEKGEVTQMVASGRVG